MIENKSQMFQLVLAVAAVHGHAVKIFLKALHEDVQIHIQSGAQLEVVFDIVGGGAGKIGILFIRQGGLQLAPEFEDGLVLHRAIGKVESSEIHRASQTDCGRLILVKRGLGADVCTTDLELKRHLPMELQNCEDVHLPAVSG